MKNTFLSKKARLTVDILLAASLISMFVHTEQATGPDWASYHCIAGVSFLILMTIHTLQHWPFIKALSKKKVIRKNKMTAFTTACFFPMLASVLLFTVGFNIPFLEFHNITGHIFMFAVIIHLITKIKRFVYLLRKTP